MSFQKLQELPGTSPAAMLHAQYVKVAPQNSGTGYWKTVLAAGVSFAQAATIIRWLAAGGLPDLPHAKTIAKNAVWYAELASRDPMATCTEVSVEAFEMAVKIAEAGFTIEPEYVQDALTKYRDFLKTSPVDDILYNHLPPGRIFIIQWFTEIMPNGTPRMRRFHLGHSRFKEYMQLITRAARRG